MDANFRLTNRMRANEHDDAELGPGWGCTVNSAPYKEHLKKYVAESDVSILPSIANVYLLNARVDNNMHCIHGSAPKRLEDDYWPAHFRSRGVHVCTS